MKVLVTGGAGYIGSHTVLELLQNGDSVVVVDNLINSSDKSLQRVKELTGKEVKFYKADLCDETAVADIFAAEQVEAVIHFAGLRQWVSLLPSR